MRHIGIVGLVYLLCSSLVLTGCGERPARTQDGHPAGGGKIGDPERLLTSSPTKERPFASAAPEVRKGEPVFAVPPGPEFSAAGYQLILDFEVGGGPQYYDAFLARPTWPGAASGVTVGVGYDCGYNSRPVIMTDWHRVRAPDRERLADTAGVTGKPAKALAKQLTKLSIPWGDAEEVFQRVTIGRFWAQTKRAFPGIEQMCPQAQWAALSVVFNRGTSMTGARRAEMREMRAAAARGDEAAMAKANRKSVRVWVGTDIEKGMRRRRYAESNLMEACGG